MRTTLSLGAALLVAAAACSASPDPCATSNCNPETRTTIKWAFNPYPERGFQIDSCTDVGAARVRIDMVDSGGSVSSLTEDCGNGQIAFFGLAPGDYTAYATPLDGMGNSLVSDSAPGAVTVGQINDNREATVNVPANLWTTLYTGTFLFRLSWGGKSCDLATPVITSQVVTLTVNGVVQAALTDDGQLINGTDKKPCKKLTDEFPQSVLNLPFGLATLTVEGFDSTDTMMFTKQFDTFVGAGISNPTLTFDVPLM